MCSTNTLSRILFNDSKSLVNNINRQHYFNQVYDRTRRDYERKREKIKVRGTGRGERQIKEKKRVE